MDCLKGDLALLDLYNGGQGTPLSSSLLDMLVRDYNASLSSIMDHHAPLKTKTVRARLQVPWYQRASKLSYWWSEAGRPRTRYNERAYRASTFHDIPKQRACSQATKHPEIHQCPPVLYL